MVACTNDLAFIYLKGDLFDDVLITVGCRQIVYFKNCFLHTLILIPVFHNAVTKVVEHNDGNNGCQRRIKNGPGCDLYIRP